MTKRLPGIFLWILLVLGLPCRNTLATVEVQDVFGRPINQHGLTLVDWDGFMANPLIEFHVIRPTNATPTSAVVVSTDSSRVYFENSSYLQSNRFVITVPFPATGDVVIRASIFPAHQDLDPDRTLTIIYYPDYVNSPQITNIPIHVLDFDSHRSNDFKVTVNFDRDVTGFFTNATARDIVRQAANDWAYYFTDMGLDPVPAGSENSFIWYNNFDSGYYFQNTNTYTGYLLYAYGTTNASLRSGGETTFYGGAQTSNGTTLPLHRSGGFEAYIFGNYNTLGWLFLTNDDTWDVTDNYGNHTNDFLSITHHEIGHALIFNEGHPGFAVARDAGAFTSQALLDYYGDVVPIDGPVDHLTGVIDPESGQGAFGYEYYGSIPRYRWTMTKLDLLCAQEVGYTLRSNAAFLPLTFPAMSIPSASVQATYATIFKANGGLPIYYWELAGGTLPPGLALDSFTGKLSGTPTTPGNYNFTIGVLDYRSDEEVRNFALTVSAGAFLSISLTNNGASNQSQIVIHGNTGQSHVLQVSTNLLTWTPLLTNTLATNTFIFTDALQPPARFYRSVYTP